MPATYSQMTQKKNACVCVCVHRERQTDIENLIKQMGQI